ncbi:MAG: IS21 family transposase [Alphaproteobacteria bacterium]|nr:IS21 family transposase [Alphaproteobacteria bacterium]
MLALKRQGWGVKKVAKEFGACAKMVRRFLKAGGWAPYKTPERDRTLAGHEAWLKERLIRHAGNADGVRQEMTAEIGLAVSLRKVEPAVAPFRREIAAAARATVWFETPPGRQLQIDFGERCVMMAGRSERTHLFVATLGYCRRGFVRAFKSQRQSAWFDGIEGAFAHFGGETEEVLLDNAKPLVTLDEVATREVVFNDRLHAFARYWGFRPVACARFRARAKGKDERGVG